MDPLSLGLSLGGSALQGLFGSRAAREQRRAAQQQQAMLAQQQAQTRQDFQPYMTLGANALGRMAAIDGGNYSAFEQSPDYQFALDQSMRANDRSAAARGSLYSGGADADRMQLASGLASQNLQNYLGRMMQQAGMGQNAAGTVGSIGAQLMGAQASAVGAQGQARANGFGALSSMVGDMAFAGGNYLGAKPGKMAVQPQGGGSVWGTGGIGAGLAGGTRYFNGLGG